jgi:Tannase and feruloyl esterase
MENYFRYMVFHDPAWNPLTANVDAVIHTADEKTARDLNATDPDLARFYARGGKLILYHGWNDAAISPYNSINYYNSVLAAMGSETARKFIRLYMVPGLQHCVGGPGAGSFGQLGTTTARGPGQGIYAALEGWVETGAEPAEIVATKFVDNDAAKPAEMTRPICPYPQVTTYKGTGDPKDASNFTCALPGAAGSVASR